MENYEKMTDEELMELSGGFVSPINPLITVVVAYGVVASALAAQIISSISKTLLS